MLPHITYHTLLTLKLITGKLTQAYSQDVTTRAAQTS
ncbi:hypothetical protein F383_29599 [Gossypium arboreum]|uniref:Uncharacterized protein n=1 Tax=Gossypium arboreum TaxID=29729 RepID=A0A0B0P9G7_GOSAR|nr:hypothetical protein F383_29599 [Gossypium arboreum]